MGDRKPRVDYVQVALQRFAEEANHQRCVRCREATPVKAVGYCLHIGLNGVYCYECQVDLGHANWMKRQSVDYSDPSAVLRAFGYTSSLHAKYVIADEIPPTEAGHEPAHMFDLSEHRDSLHRFANHLLLNGRNRARTWVAYTVLRVLKEGHLRFPPPEKGVAASLPGDQVLYSSGQHFVIVHPRIFEPVLGFVTTHFYREKDTGLRVRVPTREGERYGLVRGHEVQWISR